MTVFRISIAATLALLPCATAFAADEPAFDSYALPPGFSNARTATDPTKPQPATTVGELKSYSTLHSLGFEWNIEGDTNHDAACRVAYRRASETEFHEALPLFRVDYFGWYDDRNARAAYNMLAGSILFLRPGTEYVVRLSLTDRDGGSTERELHIHTKPVPDYGTPLRTLHVVPAAKEDAAANKSAPGDGSAGNPFRGLDVAQKAARPGDLFLLHAGDYGQATFNRSGEAPGDAAGDQARYVVWKSAGDGPVKFYRSYVTGSYLWFEGLHFERTTDAMGLRGGEAATVVVVRANTFRGFGYAIFLDRKVCGWYIADNDIVGDDAGGISGEGVELNHSNDHTVCYNRATKTADGTSYCDTNCDIFGNDFFNYSDDGVEPDYGYANNRIWGNRLSGEAGITFQAMFCGPWYIVRNQIISSSNIFKLRVQDRYLLANNTLLGYGRDAGAKVPHAHGLLTAMSRNNLWIHGGGSQFVWSVQVPSPGETADKMRRHVLFDILRADWRTDLDYDGFDWSSIDSAKNKMKSPFMWNRTRLNNLQELADGVGIERHGRTVDKEKIFANYSPPPYDSARRATFVLREGGEAVDAGIALPNIAEEFAGKSPDLGTVEAGQAAPHVGPRSGDWRAVHQEWILKHQR